MYDYGFEARTPARDEYGNADAAVVSVVVYRQLRDVWMSEGVEVGVIG